MQIARDVAEALAYLHPSVVHRDLKPQNILLEKGASGGAKVISHITQQTRCSPVMPSTPLTTLRMITARSSVVSQQARQQHGPQPGCSKLVSCS